MESETQRPQGKGAEERPGPATAAQPTPAETVSTPVATPVPRRNVITRRLFVLGGFWSTLALAFVGLMGPSLDFAWPRKGVAGAAREVRVSKEGVVAAVESGEPLQNPEGRFFLVHLAEGTTPNGEPTPGGLLALWQKCPHLGCTVPWRPDFNFLGRPGWFRCPCHGSTYTKEGGILVAGPAPRPLDRFPIEVQEDGSVVVTVGVNVAEKGSPDNPAKTVPYDV